MVQYREGPFGMERKAADGERLLAAPLAIQEHPTLTRRKLAWARDHGQLCLGGNKLYCERHPVQTNSRVRRLCYFYRDSELKLLAESREPQREKIHVDSAGEEWRPAGGTTFSASRLNDWSTKGCLYLGGEKLRRERFRLQTARGHWKKIPCYRVIDLDRIKTAKEAIERSQGYVSARTAAEAGFHARILDKYRRHGAPDGKGLRHKKLLVEMTSGIWRKVEHYHVADLRRIAAFRGIGLDEDVLQAAVAQNTPEAVKPPAARESGADTAAGNGHTGGAAPTATPPESTNGNEGRGRWLYDEWKAGTKWERIKERLAKRPEFDPIESIAGVKVAVKRYAKRHNLPFSPRVPGRPIA